MDRKAKFTVKIGEWNSKKPTTSNQILVVARSKNTKELELMVGEFFENDESGDCWFECLDRYGEEVFFDYKSYETDKYEFVSWAGFPTVEKA